MISHNPTQSLRKNQRIFQQSVWYALLASIILLTIIAIHYQVYISAASNQLKSQQILNLELGKTTLISELSNIQSDVNFLARQAELHGYFDHLDDNTLSIMASDFLLFANKKKIYDQIRLINMEGQEIIRINNDAGTSSIVAKQFLQNKYSRYYFSESLLLNRNEIFISRFDLNVEHGNIQLPLKPVIRFGTPVFNSSGEKVGVLILNYLGNHLLDNFRKATANIARNIMLLNNEGYWLSHHNRDLEWGFMLDHLHTFATDYRQEWQQVSTFPSGQFSNESGLFSFTTVYPGLDLGDKTDDISAQKLSVLSIRPWLLISHITPAELDDSPKSFLRNNSVLYLIIFVIFLIGTYLMARFRISHQMAKTQVEFEQHFRKVFESIELNIIAIDMQGNITFCNDALLHLLGYSRDQLIGKNWIETLVVNRFKACCFKLFEQTRDQGQLTSTHESWLQDRNGNEYLMRWHDTSMTDTDDNTIGLIFMGEDITLFRENEIRIRHLSEAVEQSPASVMLTNNRGEIEYVNPKFTRLTGYSLEEIKGLNPRVLKSGETSPLDYSKLWKKVIKGETWRGIFHNRKKNGEFYWESASISGIRNAEDEITHFLAVKEDITEQKMLEDRFKHCFNSAPVAMVMSDNQGKILLANETLQQMYGYSEDELLGKDILSIIPEEATWQEHFPANEYRVGLHHQLELSSKDYFAHKKSGEVFPVEIGVSSTPTMEGKLNISAIIDLTTRKKLESELLQRNEEISRNQALNTVGRMANMIAHDLRNPLSSIKMGLQIFQQQPLTISNDDALELNQIALEQVFYMEEILEDLMSYSRPDALHLDWIDIKKTIEHSLSLVQKCTEITGARIHTWFEKGLPLIHADPTKLRQVFSNLLTNAMQSVETLPGIKPEINITVQLELGESNSFIKVSIQDNGCGVDIDDTDELFEAFYTRRAKGTGLGLAISKRFIELQRGTLILLPAENGGTTAIVKLNIDPAH
ncbi:MAG: PAS domain S-box protein [Gammaproteobacteria bacterium]|nr:PAS domain S-box protein [Gammaproteobacteria bacterium]MBL6999311.1 PAS domain S-box protein [Gammaproteobacteria bacterium]